MCGLETSRGPAAWQLVRSLGGSSPSGSHSLAVRPRLSDCTSLCLSPASQKCRRKWLLKQDCTPDEAACMGAQYTAGFLGPSLNFSFRALSFIHYEPERSNSLASFTLDARAHIYEQSSRFSGKPWELISSLDCLPQAGLVSLPLCELIHSSVHSFIH